MSNKKDIGKAYKDLLQEYSNTPHNRVWENIEKHLDKPKRRIFPYWKTTTGIVILLLLISTGIYKYNHYKNTNNTTITSSESESESIKDKAAGEDANYQDLQTITTSKSRNNSDSVYDNTDENTNSNNLTKEGDSSTSSLVTEADQDKPLKPKGTTGITYSKKQGFNSNYNTTYDANSNSNQNPLRSNNASNENAVGTSNGVITLDNRIQANDFNANPIVFFKPDALRLFDTNLRFNKKIKKKKIKTDGIETHLKIFAAPTYFNTLKKGYAIDDRLANNNLEGQTNINYGIAVIFELSERSSLSFGAGKTKLGYTVKQADSTNFEGFLMKSPTFQNINFSNNDHTILGAFSSIDLKQELEYLEFPMTYSYKLINKKLGVNLYGGPSFLALIDDRIIAESSNGNRLVIGNANNLGKISVSFNLGIGLSYKLSDKFSIHTEPVFKYYINTFNNNRTFKPYSLGVGFGVQYKF